MAFQSAVFDTQLPEEVVSIIERDLVFSDEEFEDSRVGDAYSGTGELENKVRNAKNAWVPDTHWCAGFIWHYVCKANRENFLYDISNIQGSSMQYTVYDEGQFYTWHQDLGIHGFYKPNVLPGQSLDQNQNAFDFISRETEHIRKLSFSLQLSDSDEYEGGQFQLLDESGKIYTAPKKRGCLIIFDARSSHRVRKVTKGTRKSIVGWIVGPRWK
jgi:predicted 2-oxoglutarate/Fe(II)-dependent dioxygenase YbiX